MFTTDPSYHVDLQQMVASVVIASRDHALAHKEIPQAFGTEIVEELPRWFAGNTEARAFLRAFSKHRHLEGDFGSNPLYGRRDLSQMIIADGERLSGQPISLDMAFRYDATKLETRDDLLYGFLRAPSFISGFALWNVGALIFSSHFAVRVGPLDPGLAKLGSRSFAPRAARKMVRNCH